MCRGRAQAESASLKDQAQTVRTDPTGDEKGDGSPNMEGQKH